MYHYAAHLSPCRNHLTVREIHIFPTLIFIIPIYGNIKNALGQICMEIDEFSMGAIPAEDYCIVSIWQQGFQIPKLVRIKEMRELLFGQIKVHILYTLSSQQQF
ncbi:hypothetical protein FGO68_gene17620 [Halteria grandinella]|uniref:Uncharacterized protein n=1 Tax=Halteria grandinella TaxID=5974 RepID=A0A8J8NLT4_HALGN|nr:hypothetical protein FGO68_gene17620 [Halteria grandinella]